MRHKKFLKYSLRDKARCLPGFAGRGKIKQGGSAVGRGGSIGKGKADRPEGQSEGCQRAVGLEAGGFRGGGSRSG